MVQLYLVKQRSQDRLRSFHPFEAAKQKTILQKSTNLLDQEIKDAQRYK
jgi:hypothetical protein